MQPEDDVCLPREQFILIMKIDVFRNCFCVIQFLFIPCSFSCKPTVCGRSRRLPSRSDSFTKKFPTFHETADRKGYKKKSIKSDAQIDVAFAIAYYGLEFKNELTGFGTMALGLQKGR